MRYDFETAQEARDFGYEKGIPFVRVRNFSDMNPRELLGLRIRRQWVLGIRTQYCLGGNDEQWYSVDREYITLDSFVAEHNQLVQKQNLRIIGYYCYQLAHDPSQVIHLESLDRIPLSSQLMDYTGDGFNLRAFHSEGDVNNLQPSGVIVHRETQQRFFVPAAPLSRFQ